MADQSSIHSPRFYDRTYLLSKENCNQLLELWEVQKYGIDSFADPDYLCIYGLKPADWYSRGIRLLARTAVECTRDSLAELIATDLAEVVRTAPAKCCTLIDPFTGSGNTCYWIARSLSTAHAQGFELDDKVFAISTKNLSLIGAQVELAHADYASALESLAIPRHRLLVAFIAPPWGDALDEVSGLDLRRTSPPVGEVIDLIRTTYGDNKIVCATQVFELVEPSSLTELRAQFDWSALRIYDINVPGQNHGILLGTIGWTR